MHVTPGELRIVRQGAIVVRFALLDSMAYVLAEIPATGSKGSSLDQPCRKPHWGFVLEGDLTFESDGQRRAIEPGSAFHVPGGDPPHHFRADGAARVAGFEPIDPVVDASDSALAAQGFEVLGPGALGAISSISTTFAPLPDRKQIDVQAWAMSSLVLTQARFGPASGYTTDWCDAPHWGLVTAGRLAIEWEDDIEILGAGDVYHCPGGPPGHRLEAADPASILDLTPVDALAAERRVARWRLQPSGSGSATREAIAVAGLG